MFVSSNGDTDIQKSHLGDKGDFVVSAGTQNNGVIGRTLVKARIFAANTITVDMFGNVFFQPIPYKMVTHARVQSLEWKNGIINEKIGLYLTAQMRYLSKIYSYNNMASWIKIKDDYLQLPVNKERVIDYQYIEERVRELEEERVRELEEERVRELEVWLREAGFDDCALTQEEQKAVQNGSASKIHYKPIKLGDIFDVATGRDIIIGRTQKGNIPLISHQHDNNGVSKRISQIKNRRLFNYKTTLPIADRGVFLATTQKEDFHIGTRVKALTFKNGEKSENIRLFFATAINKLQVLFKEYLTNATDDLPNLEISLPVNANDSFDYNFMETYVNAIKKQCIARLKEEIRKEREAYKKVLAEH